MANLVFPQLSSGAQVQYPFRKQRVIQSVINSFADGSMLASNINSNSQRVWELSYIDLTALDQAALQNLFVGCQGPLRPFIFIDPTGNMLANSVDLSSGAWVADPLLSVTGGATDPLGGTTAFTLVNSSQTDQQVSQLIAAPEYFQYCFTIYASAPVSTSLRLTRSGASAQTQNFTVGSAWSRLVNAGQTAGNQMNFNASIVVPAAQTVVVWGPQLEPQLAPSRYRATAASGGVYQNAHLLGNSITFESDAPGLFSTLISIETT